MKCTRSFFVALIAAVVSEVSCLQNGWAQVKSSRVLSSSVRVPVTTLAENEAVDTRLAGLRAAQKTLMAPLKEGLEKGSKREAFVNALDYFMMDYAESSYEVGYDEKDYMRIIGSLLKNVAANMKDPYIFEPFHRAIREPFDFYRWAQSFMNTLITWEDSRTEGVEHLEAIDALVKQGDNVILLANHQTEGDPQVMTLMLEKLGLNALAEKMVFVAGHRVTTDPLAIPFSMGCNLLCIFSKKYLDSPPELKAAKTQHNVDTMAALQDLLTEGGQCIWMAPSGGRDRKNPDVGEFAVTPFDAKSVELFRLMAQKAAAGARRAGAPRVPKTHVFSLAMLTRKLVPPPEATGDRDVGEQRTAKRGNVAVRFGPEITDEIAAASLPEGADKAAQRGAFTACAEEQVRRDYQALVEQEKEILKAT